MVFRVGVTASSRASAFIRRLFETAKMQRRFKGTIAATSFVCAAIMFAALLFPRQSQAVDFDAVGRVEGAGPLISVGTAASAVVSDILAVPGSRVHAGQNLAKLDCRSIEAELNARKAQLASAQANFDKFRNGSRADEIAVGEAAVGFSEARADEANKTLERTEAMHEGVSVTTAHVLEVKRDARIAAALLAEARARLSLLRAGSREEDVRQAEALRNFAAADLEQVRARLDQCTVQSPVDGTVVDVVVTPGQFLSSAVPQPLFHIIPDGPSRVRVEIKQRDLAQVCLLQNATVSATAFPNLTFHAQVVAIDPVAARAVTNDANENQDRNVESVVLKIDQSGLPIGSPVKVRLDPCPPKT